MLGGTWRVPELQCQVKPFPNSSHIMVTHTEGPSAALERISTLTLHPSRGTGFALGWSAPAHHTVWRSPLVCPR